MADRDDLTERQKMMFEHNSAQLRALNEQMNRVPPLSITLTGGLWFGAGVVSELHEVIRFGLLLFAGLCNLVLGRVDERVPRAAGT